MQRQELITPNEAAVIKGVSRQAIHAAIEDGRLEFVEVKETVRRITPKALAAYKPNLKRQACGPKKRKSGNR